LKDFDKYIKNMEDVIYYARYVDDIFIIISPRFPKKKVEDYYAEISNIAEYEDFSLKDVGDNKCSLVDLTIPNVSEKITYLGYTLYIERDNKNKTKVLFGLSEPKKDKIKNRISKCFASFNETNKYGIKHAKKRLFLSLRFLTTNTKLTGAKSRVKVGIYFSNSFLDKEYYRELEEFDDFIKNQELYLYDKIFQNERMQQACKDNIMSFLINNVSFKKGFCNKTYHNFSKSELKLIKSILR